MLRPWRASEHALYASFNSQYFTQNSSPIQNVMEYNMKKQMRHLGERIYKNFGRKTLLHQFITEITTSASPAIQSHSASLLVERLGVGGGGSDVGIARSLVGAGLLLEVLGSGQVGLTSLLVGSLVSTSGGDEVSDSGGEVGEHCPFCGDCTDMG